MLIKKLVIVLSIVLFVSLVSCDVGPNPFPPDPNPQLMITLASPDAPAVDVYIDIVSIAEDFEYPNSTRYVMLGDKEHEITLRQADAEDVLFTDRVSLESATHYSYFVCDRFDAAQGMLLIDDFGAPDTNETMLRFINLSPDAPALDLLDEDGTLLFSSIAFKEAGEFIAVPSGVRTMSIREAGTEKVLLEVSDMHLAPHAAITIWAKGFMDGEGTQAFGAERLFHKFVR